MAAVSDPELVVIHPIVLLGTVDHYKRVAQDTSKRVVGVMLGESYKGRVDVVNSFAGACLARRRVPFGWGRPWAAARAREVTVGPALSAVRGGPQGPDHLLPGPRLHGEYGGHVPQNQLCVGVRAGCGGRGARAGARWAAGRDAVVAARERIVGFYSTGPTIRPADLAIHEMFRKYCRDPVLAVIDIRPEGDEGLPIKSYRTVEVVKVRHRARPRAAPRGVGDAAGAPPRLARAALTRAAAQDGKETQRTFEHIACEVGAFEVEQVGVEHLLRDVNDPSVSSLAEDVRAKVIALRGLRSRLASMSQYLDDVCSGKLPPNDQVRRPPGCSAALVPSAYHRTVPRSCTPSRRSSTSSPASTWSP